MSRHGDIGPRDIELDLISPIGTSSTANCKLTKRISGVLRATLPVPPDFDAQNAAVMIIVNPWLMGRGGCTGINAILLELGPRWGWDFPLIPTPTSSHYYTSLVGRVSSVFGDILT